jgi:uncharacterized protein (DUF302 family)
VTDYGYSVDVPEGYDEAVLRTRLAMKGEGFSILSEMHVGGLLGPQAGDERQYLILGVYKGIVSQRSLGPDLRAAVHLPCNVVVQEAEGRAVVAALDPSDSVEGASETVAPEIVDSARDALNRMLHRVAAGP